MTAAELPACCVGRGTAEMIEPRVWPEGKLSRPPNFYPGPLALDLKIIDRSAASTGASAQGGSLLTV
jgi:hypothetical protein